jgi:hypothetical protein
MAKHFAGPGKHSSKGKRRVAGSKLLKRFTKSRRAPRGF